jgi:2-keto-4-pentenoate hydratase/2-oxohepta-3-ene-1,7-dioic acid hydratase in catechol pathway
MKRRTLLTTAAAAGAVLATRGQGSQAQAAQAAPGTSTSGSFSPRGLTYCMLQNGNGLSLGVKHGNRILDVGKAGKAMGVAVPASTDEVIAGKNLAGLQKVLAKPSSAAMIDPSAAKFGPCITRPEKILMLGFNYRQHAAETKTAIPTAPVLFNKYNNALNCCGGTIKLPKAAVKFDYEIELQCIMGKTAHEVSEAEALDYVFGYATGNDFSARDLQFRDGPGKSQFMIGKTSDGFLPIGPWLVGAEVVGDPQKLKLECRVNGETRQTANTSDMIFNCAQIIAYASKILTLKPGDLFSTGTPEGPIIGKPEAQQVWLKPGDKIACSVEKLGELTFDLT